MLKGVTLDLDSTLNTADLYQGCYSLI